MEKSIYFFEEGHQGLKHLLGGKGANLGEMTRLGLPVPPGFTVTTKACQDYLQHNSMPTGLMREIARACQQIEDVMGKRFGDIHNPLLFSVRSGAVSSMPGMMDTILNLGLNDQTVTGLALQSGQEAFAYDCYRRFIQMFGQVVLNIQSVWFERIIEKVKHQLGFSADKEMSPQAWQEVIQAFKALIIRETGQPFPQDVMVQLQLAIEAVFRSWLNPRAKVYRKLYHIAEDQGTAVNIQSMVFGNVDDDGGTGVLFTRNPSTGEHQLYGEFLIRAQGEDVVAGVRTPQPINQLAQHMPDIYKQLHHLAYTLEKHYGDMQDIEFTIERKKLYILQTRSGKRTAQAAIKIAVDLMQEGTISKEEAINRIEPGHLDQLLHRSIDTTEQLEILAKGLPASPGAASGRVVLDADLAEEWDREGKQVILVTTETTPEDIHGVIAAQGVLTSRGGMTSHAAVVARGMGKPCVCGCETVVIDMKARLVTINGVTIQEGEALSIDGTTGHVIKDMITLKEATLTPELEQLLSTADQIRQLKVLTNADTPEDAAKARQFGAEGIGLCRTEHMFMSAQRLPIVQQMILAEGETERKKALAQLRPLQQKDFEELFTIMESLPVMIRLLDPPLHEFLPKLEQLQAHQDKERLIKKVRELSESNPMMGFRGCRIGIVFSDIYQMQVEAIFGAIQACLAKGIKIEPHIMIPLVGHHSELQHLRQMVDQIADDMLGEARQRINYLVGTMIEVPRAALTAEQIARHADFFSFGTNDLTQLTLGYSRDDAEGKFLNHYLEHKIIDKNPFEVLDEEGVGKLIEWAVDQGKQTNKQLKTGLCGEHGGNQPSIFFCQKAGLDYISCSPYRVPLARLAAAQAAIKYKRQKALVSV